MPGKNILSIARIAKSIPGKIGNLLINSRPVDNNFIVIWGVAHSDNVAGKQSPDGRHHEPVWSKNQCNKLDELCKLNAVNSVVIQPKSDDLKGRMEFVDRCNSIAKTYKKTLLISLHNNAAGADGQWKEAHGWALFTSRGWTMSDQFAKDIFDRLYAYFPNEPVRYLNKQDPDFEENFTVLMGMYYNAVLIEWFFQDDIHDLERIENEEISSGMRLCLFNYVKSLSEKKW